MKILAAKSSRVKKLEDTIREASKYYYNKGKFLVHNGETITDKKFDSLADELRSLYPTSDVLKMVGAPVKKQKVTLPYYMGSLDKVKPDSAGAWIQAKKGPFLVSDKLDGVSILLVYSRDGKIKAYTRGDGSIGQDISFLVNHLKIPKLKADLAVRGEIVMSREKFMSWSKEFENARNMVSGLVNRKDVHTGIKDASVIIYEQLAPRSGLPSKNLATLKASGFTVAPYKVFDNLDTGTLSALLKQRKAQSKYDIDGLVVVVDKQNPLNTSGNPEWGRAFKQTMDEDIVQTTVVNVEWNPSKNGFLKPRLEVIPVRLSGAKVTFATGFNAKFINDNKIGPGAVIRLTRSGDVIPHVVSVVKPADKAQKPPAKYKYELNKTGVDYVLTNATEFDDYHVKRIVHFFKTIGVENFSSGLVERFMGYGYDTIKKLLKATKSDFLKIEGVQDRLASKIFDGIQEKTKDVPLAKLMDATGVYKNLGERRIQMVLNKYPNILFEYDALPTDSLVKRITDNVPGYNTLTATAFVQGLPKFQMWLNANPSVTYKIPKKAPTKTSGSKSGQVVVWTGFRDKSAEEKLTNLGGTVGSAVSSKTTILVVKDKNSLSGKAMKAKSLGIKIMDAVQFNAWLAS